MHSAAPDNPPHSLLLLAGLVALGPLTIDTYLAAMPGMVEALDTSVSRVQLTISAYLLGFSVFHLVCGPLADSYGRRPILLGGLLLYLLASLACVMSRNIEELIIARFFQGVAACVGPTLGRAIARDIFGPRGAARALSQIAMIMALAPAVAPTLGGLALELFSWRSIFVGLGLYALVVTVATWQRLPETLPFRQPFNIRGILGNYAVLLRSRRFLAICLANGCLYAGLVAFLSASSFILIDMMGVPPRYMGAMLIVTVLGYMGGSAISTRLAAKLEPEVVMLRGAGYALAGGLLMVVTTSYWSHPAAVLLPMGLYSLALGLALPHGMAAALRNYSHMTATASALLGFLQMGLSSVVGALVGLVLVDSARPLAITLALVSAVAFLLSSRLKHH